MVELEFPKNVLDFIRKIIYYSNKIIEVGILDVTDNNTFLINIYKI